MRAGELLQRVEILRRGLDAASRENVQRELSGRRAHEIAEYVTDPDATFPTSIIVAAHSLRVHVSSSGDRLLFGKPPGREADVGDSDLESVDFSKLQPLTDDEKVGAVIDGQHRLAGLELAGARQKDSPYYSFELPVVFMLNLQPEDRAYVFSTINSKQTRVSSSLIVDLFGLATARSPRKTCHEVARAMNAKEGGPFFQTLKMLGKKNLPTESLTQGSFAKYLLRLISRSPDEDERAAKLDRSLNPDPRCPLRQFFIDDRDDMIVRVLENYLSAIARVYPNAWEDTDHYALKRTVGFSALMKAFDVVWKEEVARTSKATPEVFDRIAERFRASVSEDSLRSIVSNEGGATELAKRFTASWIVEKPVSR
jgi:DGQHR domain-containing protein